MNGLEIYNEILENTHNLKGTWEVTAENYLKVDGMTNGSIVLFDKTVGALGDFILEWTAEQKGGSYIHSNLCPSLRYTPEDAGIEGGGDNYAMLVYLCNYGGNPGTFNLRTEGGTKSEINTSGISLNIDTVYTFKLERLNGMYRLYQDGVLINEATDITKKKLYLGWYLWYGGTNSSYQTNFILREYNLTKIDTKSYLDSIGLTTLWSKIKSLFATKTELGSKANDSEVVHKSGDETIGGVKTFSSNIVGNLTGNSGAILTVNGSHIIQNDSGSFYAYDNNRKAFVWNSTDGHAYFYGQADKALQDSDGNQINTTYLPLSGGSMTGNILKSTNDGYLYVCGGTGFGNGAAIFLNGKDSEQNGSFSLNAHNGTSSLSLNGSPNGTLTWGYKNLDVIEEQGDGYIRYSSGLQICWGETNTTSDTGTWTYPKTFKSVPCVLWQALGNDSSLFDVVGGGNRTTSNAVFIPFRGGAGSFAPYGVACFAIGFWR